MQSQFLAAINQLCAEKNLPKDVVIEAIKSAYRAAYRKEHGNRNQTIDIELEEDSENAKVFLVKTVAEEIEDEDLDILLKDAKKYNKNVKIGDELKIDVTPMGGYGRIAAQSAKQVIMQKIQEAERDLMYSKFKDREHELVNAQVHRVEQGAVYLNIENITVILPTDQRIPGEHFNAGQRVKIYLERVIKTPKGPQLLISRTHPELIRKLMEFEIPEIQEGIVEIKSIAREPGVRCKVAVSSKDPKIDPIGSTVGQKGVRIQAITGEIHDERIDVIPWSPDLSKFLESALLPAKVKHITIDQNSRHAKVYVLEDQRALAIGRSGQNVRLASKLTGLEVDILNADESVELKEKLHVTSVNELPELSKELIAKLEESNLNQVEQLKGLNVEDFVGIGLSKEESLQIVDIMKKVS